MHRYLILICFAILQACSGNEDDRNLNDLNNKGIEAMDRQDYDAALAFFRKADAHKNANAESKANLYRNMAMVFTYKNENDSTVKYLKRGIDVAEKDSYLHHLNSAELELMNGNMKPALDHLAKAERLSESNYEIHNMYALIYFGIYDEAYIDDEKAYQYSKKAYALNKQSSLREMVATTALNTNRLDESTSLFKSLSEDFPANMYYKFQLGSSLFASGKEEEGEELMAFAAARDEDCRLFYKQFFGE